MALKLHGFGVSNFSNLVRTALLEKGVTFEEANVPPSQDAAFLNLSPLGKIPCLETDQGPISESLAILDFLEASNPTPALLPKDAYDASKVRELVLVSSFYLEPIGRRGYGVLFGKEVPDSVKESIRSDLPKAVAAAKRLAKFAPWACGKDFTYADIALYWVLALAQISAKANAGVDLVGELGAGAWLERMNGRPSVQSARATERKAQAAMGLKG